MTEAKIKQELDDAPAPTTEKVVGSQTEGKPVKEEEEEEAATEGKKEAAITGRRGIVSDPSALPDSNDPDEIRKQVCIFSSNPRGFTQTNVPLPSQVEFYFSDSNLRFDKFLFGLVGKENKWVPLKMVASFKRMQRFKDFATIQTALEASELLELNLQKTMIKRKVPLDTNVSYSKIREIQDQAQSRSLYAVSSIQNLSIALTFGPGGFTNVQWRTHRRDSVKKLQPPNSISKSCSSPMAQSALFAYEGMSKEFSKDPSLSSSRMTS